MIWTILKLESPLKNLNPDLGSDFEHPQILEMFGSGVLVLFPNAPLMLKVSQSSLFNGPNAGIG